MSESIEFYAPFAHLPGRYEWCVIHSVTHGSFACFIVIRDGTHRPVTVYHCSSRAARFMADRFPESTAIRASPSQLRIETIGSDAGSGDRIVRGRLIAATGPVALARMTFLSSADSIPRPAPYGGGDFAVWGSRWTCEGVDMEVDASVVGHVRVRDGRHEQFHGDPGILTVGSYGRLRER